MLQQEQLNSNNYFSVESLLRYSKIDEGLLNKPIAEKDAHKVKYCSLSLRRSEVIKDPLSVR